MVQKLWHKMQRRSKRVGPYCRSQISTLLLVLSGFSLRKTKKHVCEKNGNWWSWKMTFLLCFVLGCWVLQNVLFSVFYQWKSAFIWVIIYFCTIDCFFKNLKKTSSELINMLTTVLSFPSQGFYSHDSIQHITTFR